MKIYKQEPAKLIRLKIDQFGSMSRYVNLEECTAGEVRDFLVKLIDSQNLSQFTGEKPVTIQIREAYGAKNGKAMSIRFTGLSCFETSELIVNSIK